MSVDPARAKSLFLAASDIAGEAEKAAFLRDACGDDTALRRRVEALLAADGGGGREREGGASATRETASAATLEATAAGDHATGRGVDSTIGEAERFDRPAGFVAGQVIAGRYTLLEVLGEGGMGTVYRAGQTQPVRRQVALKLIKVGMDSQRVLARFNAERQALALMDHPNIARVYDGGTTEAGQPFFVMELVSGEPITGYCDRLRLPVRARLELFVLVCQAVQHAHQKGIIHRDLKPSNVMVTDVDDRATPKVIDFGVAKATGITLTDQTLGDAGAIVGTPAYMSPEQADPSAMDVDTRTDVYALGVILYELLAGSPPLVAEKFKQGAFLEMLRMVREVDPPRPSTRVSTADALPSIAASRDAEPAHLKRALQGDLDWIVMRALEKDRTRRYPTANGFAADVQRHLAHEPVEAAPPSRTYKARKLVRKHRGAVVAATLVLLALLLGIAGTTWGLVQARRHEAAAIHYAEEAKAHAKAAGDNARRADEEARSASKAEQEARNRAAAEAAANVFAQQETRRAEAEKARTQVQLTRAEWLLYAGKLAQAQNDFEAGNGALAQHYLDECQVSLRGWEHRHLWSRLNARQTLVGHKGDVTSAAFSPDGRRIVTGGEDSTAKVWDAETGRELLALKGHTDRLSGAAFSPDGRRVVTGSHDGTAKVWDAETGRNLLTLKSHAGRVRSVAFSPDGRRVVTGGGEAYKPGEAAVWDATTGREVRVINTYEVHSVSFSPDGMRVFTGSMDRTARAWDVETGREMLALKGHAAGLRVAVSSPDGRRIVTAGDDLTARVWDAETGREQLALKGHTDRLSGAAFSPDGRRIVTGSWDKTAKVWDAETGGEIFVLKGHSGRFLSVAFSPDGRRIVSASDDGTAKVWDAETGQEVPTLKGHGDFVNFVAFSPDGSRIVTCSGDKTARTWDTFTCEELLAFKGHTDWVWSVAFSPDGRRIVTGSKDQTARVWDAETGRELLAFKGHTAEVYAVAFSRDGERVVSGSGIWPNPEPGEARVWDAKTGREVLALVGQTGGVHSVAFSPDGRRIVTGGVAGTTKVWDATTGRELFALVGHTLRVHGVGFSPDGERILTASDDRTVRIWDARTGREQLVLKGHTDGARSGAFSPDGRRIVTGADDWAVKLWDAATGHEVLTLKLNRSGRVWGVAFSPDGRRIAAGGPESEVNVWFADKGENVIRLQGHADQVTSVAFSDDGRRIFAWDERNRVLAWSAADGKPIDPVDPPPMPSPGPARSPDGFRRAVPEGKSVALTDRRPTPEDNAWPLSDAGGALRPNEGARLERALPPNPSTAGSSAPHLVDQVRIGRDRRVIP